MSANLLAWMLTYLLHSTLLLGAAWALASLLPREALAVREALWRTALIGGLVTACLQVGLGVEPGLGTWRLAAAAPATEAAVVSASPPAVAAGAPAPAAARPLARRGLEPRALDRAALGAGEPRAIEHRPAAPGRTAGRWLLAAWALGALVMLAWLAASCLALAGRLAGRRPISGGGLPALLARLQEAARLTGVALSASGRIASPMAFGWRRPEICLPDRVATEMPAEQQELVLAHELAHHARRDPLWLLAARLIESLFFFQPLNRIARRRLQEIAEYRCDDWAVERTGRPVTLARCLAEVAEWNLRRAASLPVPTLAVERRRLGRRVSRLLDRAYPFPPPSRPRWLAAAMVSSLAIVLLVAPAVSSGHSAPAAPPAPAASPAPLTLPAPLASPAPRAESSAVIAPLSPAALVPVPAVVPLPLAAPTPAVAPSPPAPSSRTSPVPAPEAVPSPPAPPSPVVAPSPPVAVRSAAPASAPAASPSAAANGGWVLDDGPWRPEPLAEVAALAAQADELYALDPEVAERIGELSQRMAEAARPDAEAMARIERLSARLAAASAPDPELQARIAALSGELAEEALARVEGEEWAVYRAYLAAAAAQRELTAEERAELERLRASTRGEVRERTAAKREELDRLRVEIRRELEASRPDREEMARLREEISAELEAARPDRAELERAREEFRRQLEAARPDRDELLGRLHGGLDEAMSLRHEAERVRREALAASAERVEAFQREIEELRAEVERLRAELRTREDG